MSERKGFNPTDAKFIGIVGTDGKVRLENATKKNVEKKGGGIALLPDDAKKIEQTRRVQTARDLKDIFSNNSDFNVTDESTDPGVQKMMQEQPGLIINCLNSKESNPDMIEEAAPGMARLGFDVAKNGFGNDWPDTGDKKFDEEMTAKRDKRFNTAKRVFDQLIEKAFGQDKEKSLKEMRAKVDNPLCKDDRIWPVMWFEQVKMGLDGLAPLEQKIMDLRDQEVASNGGLLSEYFNRMDGSIRTAGDALGTLSQIGAEYARKGGLSAQEQSNLNKDMLVLSQLLWNLQRKRGEMVRKQTKSRSYDDMPPSMLLKLKESQGKSVEALGAIRAKIENFSEPNEPSDEAPKELPVAPTRDSGDKTPVIDKGGSANKNASRELGGKGEEEKDTDVLTVEEAVKSSLKDLHLATGKEIIKNWTPETKRIFLAALLRKVDDQIDMAKYFAKKDPNSLLGAWSMAILDQSVSSGGVYQKAFAAETKKFVSAGELSSMSVDKYFKDVFGYDLSKDKKRAVELKKYTNMLWPNAKSQKPARPT